MSKEKIEQRVILKDHAQVQGDIKLIGKMVHVIKNPAMWQDTIFQFLSVHRYILIIITVLEASYLALYNSQKDLYLIPWGLWMVTAVFLLVCLWAGYTTLRYTQTILRVSIMVVSTIAFCGIIGWQSWQIANPPVFAPQVFGIAIAELGEGGTFRRTAETREISDQIYERLCLDLKQQLPADKQEETPCRSEMNLAEDGSIAVTRIGVMTDSETATAQGRRIGADLVVWGQLLSQEAGGVTLRFTVLESMNRATNPDFPVVMHVTANAGEILIIERDVDHDVRQVKEVTTKQSMLLISFIRGMSAYFNQEYSTAEEQLESTLAFVENEPLLAISDPGIGLIYSYLGRSKHYLNHIDEGQLLLQQAHAANPAEPAVLIGLALGYRSQGLPAEMNENTRLAINLLNDWLLTAPNDAHALFDRGLAYQIQGRYSEAAHDYQQALESDQEFFTLYILLGVVTYELGQVDEAVVWIRKGISLAEQSGTNPAAADLELGRIYQRAGMKAPAREAYWQSIQHNPKVDRTYQYFAQFSEEQGQLDEALWAYEQMVEVSFNKEMAYNELAGFYRRQGLLSQALLNYERAIDFDKGNPLYHANLADVHLSLGHEEEALAAFDKAVVLNEDKGIPSIDARYGSALYQMGNYEAAVEMYQDSLGLQPQDANVLLNLGQTYTVLGQLRAAVDTYCQILNQDDAFTDDKQDIARDRLARLGQEVDC